MRPGSADDEALDGAESSQDEVQELWGGRMRPGSAAMRPGSAAHSRPESAGPGRPESAGGGPRTEYRPPENAGPRAEYRPPDSSQQQLAPRAEYQSMSTGAGQAAGGAGQSRAVSSR